LEHLLQGLYDVDAADDAALFLECYRLVLRITFPLQECGI